MQDGELERKLAVASAWVREEFDALGGLAEDLGCTGRDEAGPGRRYVVDGRTVVRLHPKIHHVGVGLPEPMREDVVALVGEVRDQKGTAWLNHAPDGFAREDLELLIVCAVDALQATAARPGPAPPRDGRPRPPVRRQLDDEADLTLLLTMVRAYAEHDRAVGRPSPTRLLREALYFVWEGPRLGPGRKYAPGLPHSPTARSQRDAGQHTGLVYEHCVPARLVIRDLLAEPPADTAALRQVLDDHSDRVVITRDEDRALTAAGWRDAMPDRSDRWSRYRAIGLRPQDFAPWRGGPA